MDRLRERSPGLHRFLTRHDAPWPFVRDVVIGGLVILLVLSLLWSYTGRWGSSPVVVVESGSMMHCDNGVGVALGRDCESGRLGRLGTIDPGDLILVKDTGGSGSIETYGEDGEDRYGAPGDVIVFHPDGDMLRTPVIHRAMVWLEVEPDGTFTIEELGIHGADDLDHPELLRLRLPAGYADTLRSPALDPLCGPAGPGRSGFITRGDNNPSTDQAEPHTAISKCPVQPAWVEGKARGEVPWLGLVKLLVTDLLGTSTAPNYHNAPTDCKVLLWVTLGALVGGPYAYEKVKHRRQRAKQPPAPPSPPSPPSPPMPPMQPPR